jgi:hypothetical protein
MRRGLWLGVVAAACAPAEPVAVAPLSNEAMAMGDAGPLAHGDYACRIQDGGYDYPPFRCVVHGDGGRTVLEKVEGSVRFRGVVGPSRDGFRFDGELYCPWGDCTEPVHAEFRPAGDTYVATFQPAAARRDRMVITLGPARARGGDGHGGYGYGGDGYGGDGYAGARHHH